MRILVVDSYPDAGDTLSELLQILGHETCCVSRSFEAVTVAREFRPEVVISELALSGLDGMDLCRRLRSMLAPSACFACYTSLSDAAFRRRGIEEVFDAVLAKPRVQPLLALIAALS